MKAWSIAASAVACAAPASATTGFVCQTAAGPPTTYSFAIGHGEAIGVASANRYDRNRWVAMTLGQSWISDREFKADISDAVRNRLLARIETRRRGATYDGTIVEGTTRRWIRCREG